MPLTPDDVRNATFTTTRMRSGYEEAEVDSLMDKVEAELRYLHERIRELETKPRPTTPPDHVPRVSLTARDVRDTAFSTTRFRPGYDEQEVDAFLDEAEVELARLEERVQILESGRG